VITKSFVRFVVALELTSKTVITYIVLLGICQEGLFY